MTDTVIAALARESGVDVASAERAFWSKRNPLAPILRRLLGDQPQQPMPKKRKKSPPTNRQYHGWEVYLNVNWFVARGMSKRTAITKHAEELEEAKKRAKREKRKLIQDFSSDRDAVQRIYYHECNRLKNLGYGQMDSDGSLASLFRLRPE